MADQQVAAPPQPPRLTGDKERDFTALAQWLNDFYTAVVRENFFVQASGQFDAGQFDPASLPDPASATLASAQNTANQAYTLAASAKSEIDALLIDAGSFTVADAATTAVHTFDAPLDDASYQVVASPSAATGTPASGSRIIASIAKTAASFTVTVTAAPTAGNAVTFDFFVTKKRTA